MVTPTIQYYINILENDTMAKCNEFLKFIEKPGTVEVNSLHQGKLNRSTIFVQWTNDYSLLFILIHTFFYLLILKCFLLEFVRVVISVAARNNNKVSETYQYESKL